MSSIEYGQKLESNTGVTSMRRGFTLFELLAVIGVSAGAAALLVPTVGDAREAARLQTCLSNMGQLSRGMLQYRSDTGQVPLFTVNDQGWAAWTFGGWSGRNREFWQSNAPYGNMQTNDRPLTTYLTPWEIPDEVNNVTPTQEAPRFKCPSDYISYEWQWGESNALAGLSSYDDVGTSYVQNSMMWQQVLDEQGSIDFPLYSIYMREVYEKYIEQSPARFIMLMEQPFEWGLAAGGLYSAGIQVQGYHGEFSKHVAGMADGSAIYRYFDSRHLHDSLPNPPGPRHGQYQVTGEWTACDQTKSHPSGGRHL